MSSTHMNRLALVLCSLAAAGSSIHAATLTVGKPGTPCPNAAYSTINDAINAAASGDVIEVCPALYAEQVLITKPLTIRGISVEGVSRVLLQPNPLVPFGDLPFEAVIAAVNTDNVNIQNLTIDASNNDVSGCNIGLSGIHFYNASGNVDQSSIGGVQLSDPTSCQTLVTSPLRLGGGIGVLADTDGLATGPFKVIVQRSTIQDFSASAIIGVGTGVTVNISQNSITGVGPSLGIKQFAIVLANGAVGNITSNNINEGNCGGLAYTDCYNLRSEGILLRAVADGAAIDSNLISNAQVGIFINGANAIRVTNNVVRNIDGSGAIYVQGSASGAFTNSTISGNVLYNIGPLSAQTCGIMEVPESGVANNTIRRNTISNAYCGVAYVAADQVLSGIYNNTLYNTVDIENPLPPASEPGQITPSLRLTLPKLD